MEKFNINSIIVQDQIDNPDPEYQMDWGFPSEIIVEGSEVEIYNSALFKERLLYKYTSFCMTNPVIIDPETLEPARVCENYHDAVAMMKAMYDQWRISRKHSFTMLFRALTSEYNPIWNVDGVTGTVSRDTHTGTDTNAHTGTDTSNLSGNDVTRLSGSDSVSSTGRDIETLGGRDSTAKTGSDTLHVDIRKDDTTKTGYETDEHTGDDTIGNRVMPYDGINDSSLRVHDVSTTTYESGNKHTFSDVKDAHQQDEYDTTTYNNTEATTYGKTDTMQYGKTDTTTFGRADTTQYGKQDRMTYNSTNTDTKDLLDEHIDMVIRQGNIGVVTTQHMLRESIDLTAWDNLIDLMISDFIHTYCVL